MATSPLTTLGNIISSVQSLFKQNGTGAVARTIQGKLTDFVSVKDFGAKGDGTTDDTTAITSANSAAISLKVPLLFPSGTYLVGTSSFLIDLTSSEWVNQGGASLQWTGTPVSGYGIRLVGTSNYEATYTGTRKLYLPNLLGGGNATSLYIGSALCVGDGTTYTQGLHIFVNIQGFQTCIQYLDNTWKISVEGRFLWGAISTSPSATNFGEGMEFRNCFFADGVVITANSGDWQLISGSLDNSQIVVNNSTKLAWTGAHIENPGSTSANPLSIIINGVDAVVSLRDAVLVIDNPGGSGLTDCWFQVSSSNSGGGLYIDGLQYTQTPAYSPTTNDDYVALVRSGGGKVIAKNIWPSALSNGYFYIVSSSANEIANGGFEAETLTSWISSGSGTAAVDPTTHITGKRITSNQSLKLTTTSSATYVQVSQISSIKVNQFASLQVWTKSDGVDAGHTGFAQIVFLDASQNQLSTGASATISGTLSSFTLQRLGAYAPAGAKYVMILFNCSYGSSAGSMWFDEAVLNIT